MGNFNQTGCSPCCTSPPYLPCYNPPFPLFENPKVDVVFTQRGGGLSSFSGYCSTAFNGHLWLDAAAVLDDPVLYTYLPKTLSPSSPSVTLTYDESLDFFTSASDVFSVVAARFPESFDPAYWCSYPNIQPFEWPQTNTLVPEIGPIGLKVGMSYAIESVFVGYDASYVRYTGLFLYCPAITEMGVSGSPENTYWHLGEWVASGTCDTGGTAGNTGAGWYNPKCAGVQDRGYCSIGTYREPAWVPYTVATISAMYGD